MNALIASALIVICISLGVITSSVKDCADTLRRIEDSMYERSRRRERT